MKLQEVKQLLGTSCINTLEPSVGICAFYVDMRMNSDCFLMRHKVTFFRNRDGMCSLCGTRSVFMCNAQ
jgi:hypothetical protein